MDNNDNKTKTIVSNINNADFINIHSSAIHIENKLTLKQRLAWFYLLLNAKENLYKNNTHKISLTELKKAIGYTSTNNKILKEDLKELRRTEVEWNILNKDKSNIWGVSSLLSDVEIINGYCEYSYSPKFIQRFFNPNMYAKLNLIVSKNFKSKNTLAIYTLAIDYLYIKENYGEKNLTNEELRKFLGLKPEQYPRGTDLYKHIIKKSEKEINDSSDININIIPIKKLNKIIGIKLKMSIKDDFINIYRSKKIIQNISIPIEQIELDINNLEEIEPSKKISKSKDIIKPTREIIRIESKELKEFFLQYKISITTNTIQDKFTELKEMLEHRFEGYVTYLMEYTKNQIKVSNITNVSGFFVGLLRTGSQFENYITEEQRKDNIRLSKEGRVKTLIESKIKDNYDTYVKNDFSYYLESNIDELEEEIIKIVERTHKKDTLFYDFAIKSKNNGLIDINLVKTNDRGVKTLLFNHLEGHKDKFDYEPLTFEEWKNQEITDEYLKELETEFLKTL